MTRAVLVVCVGNICRSPMAAALLQSDLAALQVSSAGLSAMVGDGADPNSIELMKERGIDLGDHVARQLNESVLRENDMVLTMEDAHSQWILGQWPYLTGRVFRWGHWQGFDVPDPYRRGADAFRKSLAMIDQGLADWTGRLGKLQS